MYLIVLMKPFQNEYYKNINILITYVVAFFNLLHNTIELTTNSEYAIYSLFEISETNT